MQAFKLITFLILAHMDRCIQGQVGENVEPLFVDVDSGVTSVCIECDSKPGTWKISEMFRTYERLNDSICIRNISRHQAGHVKCNKYSTFLYSGTKDRLMEPINSQILLFLDPKEWFGITIPCSPIYPGVEMKLLQRDKNEEVFYKVDKKTDSEMFLNLSIRTGEEIICRATLKNDTEHLITRQETKFKIDKTAPSNSRKISTIYNKAVLVGDDVFLDVNIDVKYPGWTPVYNWYGPDEELLIPDATQEDRACITIRNMTTNQSGIYELRLKNVVYKFNVEVYDVSDIFLNVIKISGAGNYKESDRNARLIVEYEAYPTPNITWYDPKKKKILLEEYQYKFEDIPRKKTMLQIYVVGVRGTGDYIANLTIFNLTKLVTFYVNGIGVTDLTLSREKYIPNEARFSAASCEVYANPEPRFYWRYSSTRRTILLQNFTVKNVGPQHYLSSVWFDLEEDLDQIGCEAKNSITYRTQTSSVFKTHVENGFQVFMSNPKPIVGDDVNMTCMVDNNFYHSEVHWKSPHMTFMENVIRLTDKYTSSAVLMFKNVTQDVSGHYTCNVREFNSQSFQKKSLLLVISDSDTSTRIAIPILVVLVVLVLIFFTYKIRLERKKNSHLVRLLKGKDTEIVEYQSLDTQGDTLSYNEQYEFPISSLQFGNILGQGAFGKVYKARAVGIVDDEQVTTVAVKVTSRQCDMETMTSLITELKIMSYIGKHLNVVNLLGACTKTLRKFELYIIVEYCPNGNLHDYLLQHRHQFVTDDQIRSFSESALYCSHWEPAVDDKDQCQEENTSLSVETELLMIETTFNKHQLLAWSYQSACGMEYLSSKRLLHGDLATRNLLLTADNIVKICDFGLSKKLYQDGVYMKEKRLLLPVKWMAIESIQDRVFTAQSDVWSYGVVLWEIYSLGATPYPKVQDINILLDYIIDGNRMDQPQHCNDIIYRIMLNCWKEDMNQRPTFVQLVSELNHLLIESYHYYKEQKERYEDLRTSNLEQNLTLASVEDFCNHQSSASVIDEDSTIEVLAGEDTALVAKDIVSNPCYFDNNGG